MVRYLTLNNNINQALTLLISRPYKTMKNFNLNSVLLIICIILLMICAYGIYTQSQAPTLEQIDQRIMHWGQHFGQHFSK